MLTAKYNQKVSGLLGGTTSGKDEKSVSYYPTVTKGMTDLDMKLDILILSNDPVAKDEDADKKRIAEEIQKTNISALRKDLTSMRENGLMSDVTIVCEGVRLPAHTTRNSVHWLPKAGIGTG